MKFTYKPKDQYEWHNWFAWYPITYVNHKKNTATFIWLRKLQRKARSTYVGIEYDLRELDGSEIG